MQQFVKKKSGKELGVGIKIISLVVVFIMEEGLWNIQEFISIR